MIDINNFKKNIVLNITKNLYNQKIVIAKMANEKASIFGIQFLNNEIKLII